MATPADNLTLHRYKCTNKGYTEDLGNGVKVTLMLIPAGEFIMGAPEDEPDSSDSERPQHQVKLLQFLMGRYPVTQAQWRVVAGYDREEIDLDPDPSQFKGDNLPVEQVSWHQAIEFCKRLSKYTGKHYQLPSEAQWEYACRAGTETAYHCGPMLTEELASYEGLPKEVGQYSTNQWGLYDMHGSIFEWCQDYWHENYNSAPNNGDAWLEGGDSSVRVLRGGSWFSRARDCRSAYRIFAAPGLHLNLDYVGFRVCCSAPKAL